MLATFSTVLPQKVPATDKKQKQCFDSLSKNSILLEVPCILEEFNGTRDIDEEINDSLEIDQQTLSIIFDDFDGHEYSYFYNYKIVKGDTSFFLISELYDPGVSGVYNVNVYLVTFVKEQIIRNEVVGCFCHSYVIGTNETIQTVPVFYFDHGELKVISTTTDTVDGWESDTTIETTTIDTSYFKLGN